jgi:SAM-dependent methyltransferase
MQRLGIEEGRRAFGADAANYDSARPAYPERVFDVLRERCGSLAGCDAFEIGAGTGLATRSLLRLGVARLVAIEPDDRLAAYLRQRSPDAALRIVGAPFEDAELPRGAFDLGAAATSFHWLDQRAALTKVATLLKPGGCWVCWWNVFGDHERHDAFHEATQALLARQPRSPSESHTVPMPLDTRARIADLEAVGTFEDVSVEILKWTLVLNPAQVRALYATYSQFSAQTEAERNRILDGLEQIAAEQFGGRVERNMCTAIYTARRTRRTHQ